MNNKFELQLIVIGVLIPAYLSLLPAIIVPILVWGTPFTLEMVKLASYTLGFLWFLCLILGTFSLIDSQSQLSKIFFKKYAALFKINNFLTIFVLSFLLVAYLSYFVITLFWRII